MSTALEFASAIRALMEVLDEGPPGMIIGGVAVIALGFPRTTVDIDATMWATLDDLDALVGRLERAGIEPRMGVAIDFAKANHVLLMRHRDSGVPIDMGAALLERRSLKSSSLLQRIARGMITRELLGLVELPVRLE
ncbi:MAG: hypothetical protein ACREXY_07220, partial [Gammaproteobacteria bacterium]